MNDIIISDSNMHQTKTFIFYKKKKNLWKLVNETYFMHGKIHSVHIKTLPFLTDEKQYNQQSCFIYKVQV